MNDWLWRYHVAVVVIFICAGLAALVYAATSDGAVRTERGEVARGTSGWNCMRGYFCVFNCPGEWYERSQRGCDKNQIDGGHWGWWNFEPHWRNEIEAQVNNRPYIALLAGHLKGAGRRYCAEPRSADKHLGNNYIGERNAESFKLFHRPGSCAHFGY